MEIAIDSDVKAVLEFMQETLAADRLVSVAEALFRLAPLLWGQYPSHAVQALQLKATAISADDPQTRSSATAQALAP
jgi:hypothetical protein